MFPPSLLFASFLQFPNPGGQLVVLGHNIVPVSHAVIVLLHELVPLRDELLDRVILFLNAVIRFFQLRVQGFHSLPVFRDGIGEAFARDTQLEDFPFLGGQELFIGASLPPERGEFRVAMELV
jgi:hypothetical protein